MYQSNLKVPVTASKVFEGTSSNMYKSSSAISGPTVSHLGPTRKVEGQDLSRSGPVVKKNFEQTISNLKSRPTQKVLEEEYIGGLQ